MADTKALIQIQNVKKSFPVGTGTVEVLKGINITINKGEFVIIFGPSGCGKSTLLHTLSGLENPTEGKVIMEDKDFYAMTEDERGLYRRDKVGMIYQEPLWISSFNVIENVMFPSFLLDQKEDDVRVRAQQLLDSIGLGKWSSYMPLELSSGQQQKISLIRSLMLDPLLIIADEPTGNLDTVSGRELLERFMKLVDEGKTIIMVTHDLEYLKYASKIYHILDGEVVEEYMTKDRHAKRDVIAGKKEIGGDVVESNVRDPQFLKKLNLT
ncbi:MAG: ABC transporter ATP-binding protein [Patescibacteria group bacterium]